MLNIIYLYISCAILYIGRAKQHCKMIIDKCSTNLNAPWWNWVSTVYSIVSIRKAGYLIKIIIIYLVVSREIGLRK